MQIALGITLVTVGVAWLGAWIIRLARQPRRALGESMLATLLDLADDGLPWILTPPLLIVGGILLILRG
jgi:hypothetical protein